MMCSLNTQQSLGDTHVAEPINMQLFLIDCFGTWVMVFPPVVDRGSSEEHMHTEPTCERVEVSDTIRRTFARWLWLLRMRRNIPPIQLAEHTGIDSTTLELLELGEAVTLGGIENTDESDWHKMHRLGRVIGDDMFEADVVVAVVRVVLGLSTTVPLALMQRVARDFTIPSVSARPD